MKTRRESAEVLYPAEEPVFVGPGDLEPLRGLAAAAPRQRARLCAHSSAEDVLQEMFILLKRGSYIRPHKHVGKAESFLLLEGEAELVLFSEDGRIAKAVELAPPSGGRAFYYRLSEPVFHTLVIHSQHLLYLEATVGPFRREQTVFAPWSPEESEQEASRSFSAALEARLRSARRNP